MTYLLDANVGDEIDAGADELAAWASPLGPGFFLKPDAPVLPALGSVSSGVTGQSYEPAAVSTFLQAGRLLPRGARPHPRAHAGDP